MQYQLGSDEAMILPPDSLNISSWFRVTTQYAIKKRTEMFSQLIELNDFVLDQQQQSQHDRAFVWRIHLTPYHWPPRWVIKVAYPNVKDTTHPVSLPTPVGECEYVQTSHSSLAQSLVDQVFETVSSSGVAFLHIRRGDTTHRCNTTLPRVHDYLMCSLRGQMAEVIETSDFGRGGMTLLFASDERDACYRQGMRSIVEQGLGYHFIDLDQAVRGVLHNHIDKTPLDQRLWNNMYIFSLTRLIYDDPRIDLTLKLRKKEECPVCETDMKKLKNQNEMSGFPFSTAALPSLDLATTLEEYNRCHEAGGGLQ